MARPYVLVADDDPLMRLLLADVLEDAGYTVRTAADGLDALALCERQRPQLLITDLRMPRLSGDELVSTLHQRRLGSFPVLLISGLPDVMRHAATLGADAIEKPVDFDGLIRKVRALVRE